MGCRSGQTARFRKPMARFCGHASSNLAPTALHVVQGKLVYTEQSEMRESKSPCSLMDRASASGAGNASSILARDTMKREFSAGCVVYKKSPKGTFFLIGKHSGYHKWVLPKGLIEKGEHAWQTAIRETEEEMGVKAKLINKKPIHKVQYFYYADLKENHQAKRRVQKYQEKGGKKTKVFKIVSFYLAKYVSGNPEDHDWEMEEAGWFKFGEALEKMAFPGEKEALKKAPKMIK